MTEHKGWTRTLQPLLAKATITALNEAGGTLRVREIMSDLAKRVSLQPFHLELTSSGVPRWETALRWVALEMARSGFLVRQRGKWILTPEGKALLSHTPDEIYALAKAGYSAWKKTQSEIEAHAPINGEEETPDAATASSLEAAEEHALTEIEAAVNALNPYDFQDLVAALLRGMGYYTVWVAPPGPDGGVDILAYQDPLGTKAPHIKVQVKHKNAKAGRGEVAELKGIIHRDREIGLFVSSGGFSPDAEREAESSPVHIELINLDRFLDLWIENYEKLSEEDKGLLRLKKVYFLAPE